MSQTARMQPSCATTERTADGRCWSWACRTRLRTRRPRLVCARRFAAGRLVTPRCPAVSAVLGCLGAWNGGLTQHRSAKRTLGFVALPWLRVSARGAGSSRAAQWSATGGRSRCFILARGRAVSCARPLLQTHCRWVIIAPVPRLVLSGQRVELEDRPLKPRISPVPTRRRCWAIVFGGPRFPTGRSGMHLALDVLGRLVSNNSACALTIPVINVWSCSHRVVRRALGAGIGHCGAQDYTPAFTPTSRSAVQCTTLICSACCIVGPFSLYQARFARAADNGSCCWFLGGERR